MYPFSGGAADLGYAARFLAFFLALDFFCSQAESQPTPSG
jgi:hypothetical protein